MIALEIPLCAQDREIEACHFNPRDLVAGDRSTFWIGIGECVAKALAASIGMALDNHHPARHGSVVFIALVCLTRINPALREPKPTRSVHRPFTRM